MPHSHGHLFALFNPRFLQRKCFDAPLQAQELEGIKAMVQEHADGGVRGGGLTEAGFLYLHTIFIQRGRLETTWTVLRKFGYAEDLRLTESFLYPKQVYPINYMGSATDVSRQVRRTIRLLC